MKVLCLNCKIQTNHDVIHELADGEDPPADFWWSIKYQIIRCAGCGAVSYRTCSVSDNDYDPLENTAIPNEVLYPSRTAGRDPLALSQFYLPHKIDRIYNEVIGALNNSLATLAAIGLRTLIEAICNNQNVAGDNLQTKINNLATAGILGTLQCEMLHSLRFLGNVAAHDVEVADSNELSIAYDIAENILNTVYVLPQQSSGIKTGRPASAVSVTGAQR